MFHPPACKIIDTARPAPFIGRVHWPGRSTKCGVLARPGEIRIYSPGRWWFTGLDEWWPEYMAQADTADRLSRLPGRAVARGGLVRVVVFAAHRTKRADAAERFGAGHAAPTSAGGGQTTQTDDRHVAARPKGAGTAHPGTHGLRPNGRDGVPLRGACHKCHAAAMSGQRSLRSRRTRTGSLERSEERR